MNSKLLKQMVADRPGGLKAFSVAASIPTTTLYDSLSSDERLSRMPIENFKKVAKVLGMTIDELDDLLSE